MTWLSWALAGIHILEWISGFKNWLAKLAARKQGRKDQRADDIEAENRTLQREQEAAAGAPKDTDALMDKLRRGDA